MVRAPIEGLANAGQPLQSRGRGVRREPM
jgi:hypothetical protein